MTNQQTEVVVIGAGYAGLLATVRLARQVRRLPVRITLVNAGDVFTERPGRHEYAAQRRLIPRPHWRRMRGSYSYAERG